MKRPIMLLCAIALTIVLLSVIFPTDPTVPDLITRMKPKIPKPSQYDNVVKEYKITGINKLTSSGDALAWSKDEKYLYCSMEVKDSNEAGLEEIWMYDMNGNKKKVSGSTKLYNISNAKWSPDGNMMAFVSTGDYKSSLMIYDNRNGEIRDITPKKAADGVTSYDWADDSSSIIMSVDISDPNIYIYNLKTGKNIRLDMKLANCRNVAYYSDNRIIYSDIDDGNYKIFSADMYGRNPSPVTEGWNFKISPDRHKIIILSDGDGQMGLWVYYTSLNEKKILTSYAVYNAYWMQDSNSLMYSIQEDDKNNYTYKGDIYYYGKDSKTISITDAIYTIFLPSGSGNKIAMDSPKYAGNKKEEMGIFAGDLYKQP